MATRKLTSVKARLSALRAQMQSAGVQAYIVPSSDQHQSEYVPDCWQRRPWISGFTGSAGDVVVTAKGGGLWTDGRYYLQAEEELKGSGLKLFKAAEPDTPSKQQWLANTLAAGSKVGVDPKVLPLAQRKAYAEKLAEADIELVLLEDNLVDAVWDDQPEIPQEPVMALASRFTGETSASKLKRLRKALREAKADAHVVTMLDSVAWLFNIRGRDVSYNPVAIAYALVTAKEAVLFIHESKLSPAVRKSLGRSVQVRPYEALAAALAELGQNKEAVLLDPSSCNTWIESQLKGAQIIQKPSPILAMKACKNPTEIEGMRRAHVRDGAAVVRFLRWLEQAVPKGGVTELSAAEQLEEFRREGEHFQGLSFRTISGYAQHGAVIHYSVTPESSLPIQSKGIYLVDSGAQYLDGTTDITRTVLLGKSATREQRDRFTRVLKGHIALARVIFPKGVSGVRLDTLARLPLWSVGLDYGHGTGHGVGAFLNVHEGPQSISVRGTVALEPGNILSNEPGFYEPGAYGIRIENLVLVSEADFQPNGTPFYRFETLTQCPIDTRLIDRHLLDEGERRWLNDYHKGVYRTLAPMLAPADKRWLKKATAAI